MQAKAQSTDFYEFTKGFFSQPKSYSVTNYVLPMLGNNGVTLFDKDEASFTVTSKGYSYKFKDGSGASKRITYPLKNVTVLTSDGDITMQMYVLEDDDTAVRAVKLKDGHCMVFVYVYNISSGKYILNHWFTLRK